MAVYVVTGKLGGGKTIISVKKILEKIQSDCLIATNLDLKLNAMLSPFNKTCRVIRIPDKPTIHDLTAIGKGTESYDETKNGLLVLDECGTWFNSRGWQDKSRTPVNDWFLHARKLGWDVILNIQDIGNLDSQARSAIAEHTVFCRRTDRLAIPYLSSLFKFFTGFKLGLPKVHLAKVVYGTCPTDLLVDRWTCSGTSLYAAYDTKQTFLDSYQHGAHSLLPPYFTHGYLMAPRNLRFYMKLTKIYWRKFRAPLALSCGMLVGTSLTMAGVFANNYYPYPDDIAAPVIVKTETPVVSKSDDVLDAIANMRILGSMVVSSNQGDYQVSYDIGTLGKDMETESVVRFRTDLLAKSGYTINAISDCAADIVRDGRTVTVYCF